MQRRALIVEDEILVALDIERVLSDAGVDVVGIATDSASAMVYADSVDLALVDLNLRDGRTGTEIGRRLARDHGVAVVFVTANPAQLGDGIEGTLGVMTKPFSGGSICAAIDYLAKRKTGAKPPRELQLFG